MALPTALLLLVALLAIAARPALADSPPQALSAGGTYRAAVLGDHPTSYWRLGEQPGTTIAADELNHHPGYFNGPLTLGVAHPVGDDPDTAIDLDGLIAQPLGQFIHVPDDDHLSFDGRVPFSLEAWVSPRGSNDVTRRIFSKEGPIGGYLLGMRNGVLVFSRYVYDQWGTVRTGIDADRWSHVLATYDGTLMQIYVDGSLRVSKPSYISLPPPRSDLSIGAKQSRWRFFAGGLDELAIYPYALSADRALAHSQLGGGASR